MHESRLPRDTGTWLRQPVLTGEKLIMKTSKTGNKFYDAVLALNHAIGVIEMFLAKLVLILLVVVCVIFIASRFIFHVSVPWADELSRDFLIALGWLGAGYAASNNDHLSIDLLSSIIKDPVKREKVTNVTDRIAQILSLIFLVGFMFYYGKFLKMQIAFHQPSSTLPFPLWVPMSWIMIGVVLVFLHVLVYTILPKKYWPGRIEDDSKKEKDAEEQQKGGNK